MKTRLLVLLLLVNCAIVYPQTENQKSLKVEMIQVEGGTFMMGSNDNLDYGATPVHKVTVSSFHIGKTEVTQGLWKSVMGKNPSEFKGEKRPVELVDWYDVLEFCNKLSEKEGLQKAYSGRGESITCDFSSNGYRLPTEAEWEYAARGGKQSQGYKYSGSDNLGEVGWYGAYNNSGNRTEAEGTSEVGKRQPNELGIHDMSGNVKEWCWDRYGDYPSGSKTNPRGPDSPAGYDCVFRGGEWHGSAGACRVANRNGINPAGAGRNLGFRLVRTK